MKHIGKVAYTMLLTILFCMVSAVSVYAADEEPIRLNLTEESEDEVSAQVVADRALTDGVLTLSYDSSLLGYAEIEIDENIVALYSVKDNGGVLSISWISTEKPKTRSTEFALFKVKFSGDVGALNANSIKIFSATAHIENGEVIHAGTLDVSKLEAAIGKAQGLDASQYTQESYKVVEDALTAAKNVLANPIATQKEIDEATDVLEKAIAALVKTNSSTNSNNQEGIGSNGSTNSQGSNSNGSMSSGNLEKNSTNVSTTNGVNTGDDSNLGMMLTLIALGLVAMAGAYASRKRGVKK